jgi:hypothetical protein
MVITRRCKVGANQFGVISPKIAAGIASIRQHTSPESTGAFPTFPLQRPQSSDPEVRSLAANKLAEDGHRLLRMSSCN